VLTSGLMKYDMCQPASRMLVSTFRPTSDCHTQAQAPGSEPPGSCEPHPVFHPSHEML
jgi:hypothetical protein